MLVAIGRVPFTDGLGLEEIGVRKDNKGRIIVDERFATNVPGHLCHRGCDRRADAGAQGGG